MINNLRNLFEYIILYVIYLFIQQEYYCIIFIDSVDYDFYFNYFSVFISNSCQKV